ncbi:MAG: cyclic pyranopterin monophosphate synthase MoaC [Thermoprotei archaeon]|nr:MAG: cyclic pyranopterin monophosphate synthase MoaC [Thermoprotei archaeon]RLF02898.1 MAG: cyclic pyranopterin monophosphate synthase MoaC [Thermoprotei archaeon]
MVDITSKEKCYREALAYGRILLRKETIKLILERKVEKGDVLTTAQVAAILAVKRTPEIIPLCHPIPLTGVDVEFKLEEEYIEAFVRVRTLAETGVEMEALIGVTTALLTIWDMVKKYEKDSKGQYPRIKITDVKVIQKTKKSIGIK